MEKYINELVEYLTNLKDFRFLNMASTLSYAEGDTVLLSADNTRNNTYNNMGATILDGILQAGLNYENVVKPRVDRFLQNHRTVKTTSEFHQLINSQDLSELINMKGQKIERIHALANFLKRERIETEDDFYNWLSKSENLLSLSNIKGIKGKTIDYLKILTGHKGTVAVDIHLINFIRNACPELEQVSYEFGKELLMQAAKRLKVDASTLDYSIWSYMSKQKSAANVKQREEQQKHEVDQPWNGYCPESQIVGKKVKMRLNKSDLFESEVTGLQIALGVPGVQAVILKTRGHQEFRTKPIYGHEVENGELLSPQNLDRHPYNFPVEVFKDTQEIEYYIKKSVD